jgi:hypothetical protein
MDFIKLFNIYDIKSEERLIKYIDFCLKNHDDAIHGANHHILPSALFKQYSDLKNNKWNCARLSYYNHYIAHFLLYKAVNHPAVDAAIYGMHNKDYKNGRLTKDQLISEHEYTIIHNKVMNKISSLNKRKVISKDLRTGKNVKVSCEEFNRCDHLVGATIGKGGEHLRGQVSILIDGIAVRINKEEFDPNIHIGITKGKTMYKDKDCNTFQTTKDDPRVISGELVGINKGKKYDHFEMVTCPHCGKEGKNVGGMKRHHFNNCKKLIENEI